MVDAMGRDAYTVRQNGEVIGSLDKETADKLGVQLTTTSGTQAMKEAKK